MGVRESLIGGASLMDVPVRVEGRGRLASIEFDDALPFVPKRLFTIGAVPDAHVRGEHAHRLCHQFLLCVNGSVSVLIDDGTQRRELELDSPAIGLYLPPLIWSVQSRHTPDAVVIVLASHAYDAHDYIRTYRGFLEMKQSSPAGEA